MDNSGLSALVFVIIILAAIGGVVWYYNTQNEQIETNVELSIPL